MLGKFLKSYLWLKRYSTTQLDVPIRIAVALLRIWDLHLAIDRLSRFNTIVKTGLSRFTSISLAS